jgi:hypothetical protein
MSHSRLSLADLLNPIPDVEPPHNREDLHDIRPLLLQLSNSGLVPIRAPRFVYDWLFDTAQRLPHAELAAALHPDLDIVSRNSPLAPSVQYNITLNRKTTLSRLFIFEDPSTYLEYPDTDPDRPVGYLFRQLPESWYNPTRNFVYSLGDPSGATRAGDEVICTIMVDRNGVQVPCTKRHWTCMLIIQIPTLFNYAYNICNLKVKARKYVQPLAIEIHS